MPEHDTKNNRPKNYRGIFSKKTIRRLIKIFLICISYGYIFFRLSSYQNIYHEIPSITDFDTYHLYLAVSTLFLMFINWTLEAQKWRLLIRKIEKISLWKAVIAVFSGITIGIFTPNRVGEWGGRVFVLKPQHRIKAVLATVVGSISQLTVTVITGFAAFVIMLFFIEWQPFFECRYIFPTILISSALCFLLLYIFFNIKKIAHYLENHRRAKQWLKYYRFIFFYTKSELSHVLIISLLRYFTFSTQFYLLLLMFDLQISVYEAYLSIALTYFFITIVPTVTMAEAGLRGSAALICIGMFSNNTFGIVAASMMVWIINLMIPALTGSLFLFIRKTEFRFR